MLRSFLGRDKGALELRRQGQRCSGASPADTKVLQSFLGRHEGVPELLRQRQRCSGASAAETKVLRSFFGREKGAPEPRRLRQRCSGASPAETTKVLRSLGGRDKGAPELPRQRQRCSGVSQISEHDTNRTSCLSDGICVASRQHRQNYIVLTTKHIFIRFEFQNRYCLANYRENINFPPKTLGPCLSSPDICPCPWGCAAPPDRGLSSPPLGVVSQKRRAQKGQIYQRTCERAAASPVSARPARCRFIISLLCSSLLALLCFHM